MNGTVGLEDGHRLECPGDCSDAYLHHGRVRVSNRVAKDGEGGPATVCDVNGSHVAQSTDDSPPGYRNSVEIELLCEHCGPVGHLLIKQHKGSTYMTMEPDEGDRAVERAAAWEKFQSKVRDPNTVVSVNDSTWELR